MLTLAIHMNEVSTSTSDRGNRAAHFSDKSIAGSSRGSRLRYREVENYDHPTPIFPQRDCIRGPERGPFLQLFFLQS